MNNTKFSFLSTIVIVTASMLVAKSLELASSSQTELKLIDGNYQMEVQSIHGNSYFYQHSTDLQNWNYLPHIQYGTGNILQQNLTDPLGEKNFFRVKDSSHPSVDPKNDDFDGDGVSNHDEVREGGTGTDPFVADTDGDGNSDYETDTNNDGFHDGWPLDHFDDVDFDPEADDDGDGIDNGQEAADGSNPHVHADLDDTDEDGLTDAEEIALGTDPFDSDTDSDGLNDGEDADPLDKAVAWKRVVESQYAVVDLGVPSEVVMSNIYWYVQLGEKGHVLLSRDSSPEPDDSSPGNNVPDKSFYKTYGFDPITNTWSSNLILPNNIRATGSRIDSEGNIYATAHGSLGGDFPGTKATAIYWERNETAWDTAKAIKDVDLAADFGTGQGVITGNQTGFSYWDNFDHSYVTQYGKTAHLIVESEAVGGSYKTLLTRLSPTSGDSILLEDENISYQELSIAGEARGWHAASWVNSNDSTNHYLFSKLTEANTYIDSNPPEGAIRNELANLASISPEYCKEGVAELVIWSSWSSGFQVGSKPLNSNLLSWQASTKLNTTETIGGNINSQGIGLRSTTLWRNGKWYNINDLVHDDTWEILRCNDIINNGTIVAIAKKVKNPGGSAIPAGNQQNTVVLLTAIDLVTDSDNNDGSDFPKGGTEETIAGGEFSTPEDIIKYPGKILYSQNGDIDRDGVPDYADGFSDGNYTTDGNGIGRTGLTAAQLGTIEGAAAIAEIDTPQTADMVPIILRIPKGMTDGISVKIDYTGSNPNEITKELKDGRYYYMLPDDNSLRLWTKNRQKEDCSVMDFGAGAESGDYIPNSITLGKDELEKLTYDSAQGGYILWVESVATSKEIRDQSIHFEITRPAQNGGASFTFIDKTVYFTTINMNLVQLHKDGTGEAASGEINMSHTSPVIESELDVTEPRWGLIKDLTAQSAGSYGWVVDITVKGSILSPLLDTLTPEQGGTIDKAYLYANGVEDHIRELHVAVTKGYTPTDILAPFPYKGTIDKKFTGVEVIDGINILEVRTADKVYRLDGYHQHSFTVTLPENPPEDYEEDPTQPDPESFAMHERGYVLKPHIDPANPNQPLSEVDTYTISAEGNASLTNLIIHRSTDPLEPDEFRDVNNTVHLKITPYTVRSVPRVSGQPFEYFRAGSLHLYLYSGFALDGNACLCTYCPPPLDEDGNPTTTADGMDEYCGLITTFSSSGQQIQITDAEPIDQSDGGEFHPYIWELAGPLALIESMQGLQISDGSRSSVDVDVPGGSRKVEFNADVAKVKLEIAEEARRDQEERDRAFLANSFNSAVPGIVSFKPAEQAQQKAISDEFFAAVNRVKALELYPESELDFAKGVAVGVAKGGVEMVGGLKDAVVLVGKVIYKANVAYIRGIGYALKVVWKLATGQSLEQERRQAAEVISKARKSAAFAVKKFQFFKELMNEGKDVLLVILSGDFRKLNRLSGHMRMMISFSIEVFVGLLEAYGDKSDYEKGIFVGRAVFEVGSLFIGVGAIAKAGQVAARISKAKFLTRLAETPMFVAGKGAVVMENVKNGVGKGLGIVGNTVKANLATKMCFIAGTLVATASADEKIIHKPIEQIQKGDIVWAKNEKTGEVSIRHVLQTFTTHPDTLYHLQLDHDGDGTADETIAGTYQHPFWEADQKKWIEMGELKAGNTLHLISGKTTHVLTNTRERAPPSRTFNTYNFEVEKDHTYFVGQHGVWVHNEGASPCEIVFSTFFEIGRRLGLTGNDLKVKRFEILVETRKTVKDKLNSRVWGRSSADVGQKMLDDYAAGVFSSIDEFPTYSNWKNKYFNLVKGSQIDVHHSVEKYIQTLLDIPVTKLVGQTQLQNTCPGIPLPRNKVALDVMNAGKKQEHHLKAVHKGLENGGISNLLQSRIPINSSMTRQEIVDELWDIYDDHPDLKNQWPVARDWLRKLQGQGDLDPTLNIPN